MFWRKVEWLGDASVLRFQLFDAFGLAFERDDAIVVAIQEREDVSVDIECQYALG